MTNGADLCGPARIGAEAGAFPSTGYGSRPCDNVREHPSGKSKWLETAPAVSACDYNLEGSGLKVLLATRPRALLRSILTPHRSKQKCAAKNSLRNLDAIKY